jgi:alkylation response protein AidB-like acyl-CoA dehydrogenase
MAIAYHGTRNQLFQAVWFVERERPSARERAMCHAAVRDATGEVVAHAHQVHGALGATNDHALQQFTRRAKIYQHTLGTAAQFREQIAELEETLVLPEASEPLAGGFA